MSHEIYYTSAPQGLKRGTSGFCTVGASDNIPKALWDRLETLSAYRHHFAAGQSEGAGQNPTSYAHWILNVTNKTHHVLSRVCDSGVDHTHRTNAFAHHLVLDPAEIDAAPGGPAWLLEQPGVMAHHWDSQVGPISRAHLPRGDTYAGVCNRWAAATGDAGWGGHLADSFVKAPARPICILFSPGQDLLPLIAETLALLPSQARWNVTFNTYFTSMPTSATCLWRCCLAGTPAAQVGLRYAANGLVLDLTDRSRLPALPAGPYVTVARTGQALPSARPAAAAAAQARRPAAAAAGPAAAPPGAANRFDRKQGKAEIDEGEDEVEKQRDRFFDFAAQESQLDGAISGGEYELAGESPAPPQSTNLDELEEFPARAPARQRSGAPVSLRRADDALFEQEREADRAAQRRRKQVMWLFMGAVGALAVGTGVIYYLSQSHVPQSMPNVYVKPPASNNVTPDPNPPSIVENTQPTPIAQTVPAHPQTQVADAQPATATATAPVVVATAPVYPDLIILSNAIERPAVGTGMGERDQAFPLRAADLDHPATISGLKLHTPFRAMKPAPPAGAPDNSYASDTLGIISGAPANRSGKQGLALNWKTASDTTAGTEVAYILFNRTPPSLEIQWKASAILKLGTANTDLFPTLFWVLQNSTIELQSPRALPQRVAFQAFDPPPLSLNDATSTIDWPVELPHETSVIPPRSTALPEGWEATWYTDWEAKDAALRTPANASQVLKFKKATGSVIDPLFTLTFRPGLSKVECSLAKSVADTKSDLAHNESQLAQAQKDIDDARARVGPNDKIENYDSGRELIAKRDAAQKLVDTYKSAVKAYDEISTFGVSFDLPDGVRLATVHFKQAQPP